MASRELTWAEHSQIRIASFLLLVGYLYRHGCSLGSKALWMYVVHFPIGLFRWVYAIPVAVMIVCSLFLCELCEKGINRRGIAEAKFVAVVGLIWLALIVVIHHEGSPIGNFWFIRWPASFLGTNTRRLAWLFIGGPLVVMPSFYHIFLPALFYVRWGYRGVYYVSEVLVKDFVDDFLQWSCHQRPPADILRYAHTRLTRPESAIRLLLLHPGSRDWPVSCTLFETELKTAPRYEAVSYTWGHDPTRFRILIDGREFLVTPNAHELLRAFRSTLVPRILWIDSICINQQCDDEKSQQVKLMGDIYESASLVTVWLGSPPAEAIWDMMGGILPSLQPTDQSTGDNHTLADLARGALLRNTSTTVGRSSDGRPMWHDRNQFRLSMFGTLFSILAFRLADHLGSTPTYLHEDHDTIVKAAAYRHTPMWEPLMRLLEHDWFERVWVVQEVVLATSIRVVYGGVQVDWEELAAGLKTLLSNPGIGVLVERTAHKLNRTARRTAHLNNVAVIEQWRGRRLLGEPISFSDIVFRTEYFDATCQHDKIYGILGFCDKGNQTLTEPQYSRPLTEVYLDAARRVIHEEGVVRILAHAGIGYVHDATKELPSWVPDWSCHPHTAALGYTIPKLDYCAGGSKGAGEHEPHGNTLLLRGHLLDTIAELAPPYDMNHDTKREKGFAEMKSLRDAYFASEALVMTSGLVKDPYPHCKTPASLKEAFWRLLIGDRTDATRPADDETADVAASWDSRMRTTDWDKLAQDGPDEPASEEDFMRSIFERRYLLLLTRAWGGRRVAVTSNGYVCLVPRGAREGDVIWLVKAAQTPFVLRPEGQEQSSSSSFSPLSFKLVGDCYVHGVMDGEALDSERARETIRIV